MVVQFFQTSGEGQYCFPIDLANSSVSGIQDGANVTIQIIFDGGDGSLYQVRITHLLLRCSSHSQFFNLVSTLSFGL